MSAISRYLGGVLGVKVDRGHLAETSQRLLDSGSENLPDRHLILKLDLGFSGMDIDVY